MRSRAIQLSRKKITKRSNPFRFDILKRKSKLLPIVVSTLFILLAYCVYWFLLGPAFAISNITINGDIGIKYVSISEIITNRTQDRYLGIFRQDNLFLFNSKKLENSIIDQFAVNEVEIKKERPNTIIVTISAKPRKAVWSSKGFLYAIDAQGIIMGSIQDGTQQNLLLIYDQSGESVEVGESVIEQDVLNFINQLFENDFFKTLNPEFVMFEKSKTNFFIVKIGEYSGWNVYFSTEQSINEQINNLMLTLRSSIPPSERGNLNYIDLRFGKRVYYK